MAVLDELSVNIVADGGALPTQLSQISGEFGKFQRSISQSKLLDISQSLGLGTDQTRQQLAALGVNVDAVGKSAKDAGGGFQAMGAGMSGMGPAADVALAAITAVVAATKMAMDEMGEFNKLSALADSLGIDPAKLDSMKAATKGQGGNEQSLVSGMEKLQEVVGKAERGSEQARESLSRLLLTPEDVSGKTIDEALLLVVDRLRLVQNESERRSIAQDLLGGGARDAMRMAADDAGKFAEAVKAAHESSQLTKQQIEVMANASREMGKLWDEMGNRFTQYVTLPLASLIAAPKKDKEIISIPPGVPGTIAAIATELEAAAKAADELNNAILKSGISAVAEASKYERIVGALLKEKMPEKTEFEKLMEKELETAKTTAEKYKLMSPVNWLMEENKKLGEARAENLLTEEEFQAALLLTELEYRKKRDAANPDKKTMEDAEKAAKKRRDDVWKDSRELPAALEEGSAEAISAAYKNSRDAALTPLEEATREGNTILRDIHRAVVNNRPVRVASI